MNFKPHGTLHNRSFIGLLIAQFQAAFSDQAIQASAMFYAIRLQTLPVDLAISLLPILFYSPWAIFVTWAGYLADRYSKQNAIRFWKVFEVGIVLVTFTGFVLGSVVGRDPDAAWARYLGSYMVMSTVFLMGMQSAFFVPAKYGIMPEMLQPHQLSRGNGILESLSFLAIILGTVAGGVLIWVFGPDNLPYHEPWLGVILIGLSLIGASCSFLVERVPAANPQRSFPRNPFGPIFANVKTLLRSRPLLFAVLGIAFFTFMVAFMRNTMYMHGESRIPSWNEFQTSLVVGVVALGVGLGAPLAGYLSGGKVELGLVPLGGLGMIGALLASALFLNLEPALVVCVAAIGFFTGFYIVPLFTLLQHRAPKASKGDLIATSNFINVIGAIVATVLFYFVVNASSRFGIIFDVPSQEVVRGELVTLVKDKSNPQIVDFTVKTKSGDYVFSKRPPKSDDPDTRTVLDQEEFLKAGGPVVVVTYLMEHGGAMPWSPSETVKHYKIVESRLYPMAVENKERLPRFLFLGGSAITLLILLIMWRQLPDIFARTLLWFRAHGRYHLRVVGLHNIPQEGAAILATNCDTMDMALQVVAATERTIAFFVPANAAAQKTRPMTRFAARGTDTMTLPADNTSAQWNRLFQRGVSALRKNNLLGISVDDQATPEPGADLLQRLQAERNAPILPVYCGPASAGDEQDPKRRSKNVRVVIGEALPPEATVEEVRRRIQELEEWIHGDEG